MIAPPPFLPPVLRYLAVMPYRWSEPQTLTLWPHRSLAPRGFVAAIAVAASLSLLPLLSQLGHPGLWVLLAFLGATIAALWVALRKSNADRAIVETLTLTPTELTLIRMGPRGKRQSWAANPHWTRLTLHPTAGPVPHYLTLTGQGREVELGAFLTEAERIALKSALETRLATLG